MMPLSCDPRPLCPALLQRKEEEDPDHDGSHAGPNRDVDGPLFTYGDLHRADGGVVCLPSEPDCAIDKAEGSEHDQQDRSNSLCVQVASSSAGKGPATGDQGSAAVLPGQPRARRYRTFRP
jgi:hypothetical protein